LLKRGASPDRSVTVLSDNSTEHALLMLAAMHAGITYSAISPAYSLVSKDYAKLKNLIARLDPDLIYVGDYARYRPALDALAGLHEAAVIVPDADAAGAVG